MVLEQVVFCIQNYIKSSERYSLSKFKFYIEMDILEYIETLNEDNSKNSENEIYLFLDKCVEQGRDKDLLAIFQGKCINDNAVIAFFELIMENTPEHKLTQECLDLFWLHFFQEKISLKERALADLAIKMKDLWNIFCPKIKSNILRRFDVFLFFENNISAFDLNKKNALECIKIIGENSQIFAEKFRRDGKDKKPVVDYLQKEFVKFNFDQLFNVLNIEEKREVISQIIKIITECGDLKDREDPILNYFIEKGFDFTYKSYFSEDDNAVCESLIRYICRNTFSSDIKKERYIWISVLEDKTNYSVFDHQPFYYEYSTSLSEIKDLPEPLLAIIDELAMNHQTNEEFNL